MSSPTTSPQYTPSTSPPTDATCAAAPSTTPSLFGRSRYPRTCALHSSPTLLFHSFNSNLPYTQHIFSPQPSLLCRLASSHTSTSLTLASLTSSGTARATVLRRAMLTRQCATSPSRQSHPHRRTAVSLTMPFNPICRFTELLNDLIGVGQCCLSSIACNRLDTRDTRAFMHACLAGFNHIKSGALSGAHGEAQS